ncbi:MAG: SpoIIE family protein phosphatase [Candidatus Tectimicrobiota bacterium]
MASASVSTVLGSSQTVPFTILIADDDRTNRMVLGAMLQKDGHTVCVAEDGKEAVALFADRQPDMVLMDVMMPDMDGYEATRRIKALAGERFVPVIFLTALTDEQALAECVTCGGDDFLTKPYRRVILKAKIDALARVRQLYTALQNQNQALTLHHQHLQREYAVAEKLFRSIVHPGCLDAAHLKYVLSPMAIFNGDLLLVARKPSGGLHILLGDFTGHGLPAAVGAMPTADIFYTMTAKGYAIGDILCEMNQRLKLILPTGVFCAACLMDLDGTYSTLTFWNGGIPDVLLWQPQHGALRRLPSHHLPLGVVDNARLDRSVEMLAVSPGERIYAYTDGVIEVSNPQGELFGQKRLEAYFARGLPPEQMFEALCAGLHAFRAGSPQADDLTLLEITCDACLAEQTSAALMRASVSQPPMPWQMRFTFSAELLRRVDPLPHVLQPLIEFQGLHHHREHLYTILTELFSNALEHGLLGLDSALKQQPQGFVAYYTAREQQLAALTEGSITITLIHTVVDGHGELLCRVEDSGPGFAYDTQTPALAENTAYCGRGIPLVRALCKTLTYRGSGNCAEAIYVWC